MTTTLLSPLPVQRFFDNNNNPLVGGQLWTYAAGTSTPQATYTDSTGVTPNTNPVVLNSRGEGNVWMTPGQAYKFVLEDALSNVIWTVDQINSASSASLNVRNFGATGNGTTDDTAAIQAAINVAGPLGKQIFFPAGSYLYSGVTISSGWSVSFLGEATASTFLILSSGTATGFTCATDLPVVFDSLSFLYKASVTGTAGAFIAVPGNSAGNLYSQFRNLSMNAPFVGLSLSGAGDWRIDKVVINGYLNIGIYVSNTFNVDEGDSTIINSEINTTSTTAYAVLQASSGGLRIINNKMIGGIVAYQLALAVGANTSDLLITGNSMEAQSSGSIEIRRAGASGTFHNIVVSSNQFAGSPTVLSVTDSTTGWLGTISIIGNVSSTTGSTAYNFGTGDSIILEGNTATGTGVETGVAIASPCTNVRVGINCWTNFATPINNASASSTVAKKVYQTTTGNITCSTAYGSLFAGNLLVSFPTGFFQLAPIVTVTAISGTSAVSAIVSGASGTGCTVSAIAFTSGSIVTCYVRAEADY